jgi:hypothetical protein
VWGNLRPVVGDGYVWWGVLPIVGVGMGRSYPMGMYPLPSLGASRPTLNVGRKTNTGHARERKKRKEKKRWFWIVGYGSGEWRKTMFLSIDD